MNILVILELAKHTHSFKGQKLSNILQAHVKSCSLCRHEKMTTDKYQLQTTKIPFIAFAKVLADLIVDCH